MAETPEIPTFPAWTPRIDLMGALTVPLTSGEWELIVQPDGQLFLTCIIPDLQGGQPCRCGMWLGETDHEPKDLVEGINTVRTLGRSSRDPN